MKHSRTALITLALIMLFVITIDGAATAGSGENGIIANGDWGDNATWTLDETGRLTISGTGKLAYYPHSLDDYSKQITVLELQNGISTTSNFAFNDFKYLTRVIIPNSLTRIEYSSFSGCKQIHDIEYDGTCSNAKQLDIDIGNDPLFIATWHCLDGDYSLVSEIQLNEEKAVQIESNEAIKRFRFTAPEDGYYVFKWSESQTVYEIMPTVYSNGEYFSNFEINSICCELKQNTCVLFSVEFYVDDPLPAQFKIGIQRTDFQWRFDNGVLTLTGCDQMPQYDWDSAPWYDMRNQIKTVVFEEGLTTVGTPFYQYPVLTTVVLPSTMHCIISGSFMDCYRLSSVILPDGIRSRDVAYYNSGDKKLRVVKIPENCICSDSVFLFCTVGTVVMPDLILPSSLTTIESEAFTGSDLEYILIHDGVQTIGNNAFAGCKSLKYVQIDNPNIQIDQGAFAECDHFSFVCCDDYELVGLLGGLCEKYGCDLITDFIGNG